MAKISHFRKQKSFIYLCSHFGTEFLLFLILASAVATNLFLRTNSTRAQTLNRSLFFVYLKNNPERNQPLVDAYESVKQKPEKINLASLSVGQKEVLAATSSNIKSLSGLPGPLPTLAGSALLKPNPSTSGSALPKRDIEVYEVRGGDTVARIAAAYGVSQETILSENNLTTQALIKPGQELKILPMSGVSHKIQKGETLGGIAAKYNVDLETILEYNDIEIPEHILPGEVIIIPNGARVVPPSPQRQTYLASLSKNDFQKIDVPAGYVGGSDLIWPMPAARRLSQKFWSRHRALDIPCRDCAVNASASGIVELAGWQTGYGYTIVINHGQGLKTRYAHASKLLVAAGQSVSQGEQIMISGSTGRSTGPHLHFEIIKNGVLVDPLTLVR
ncbi:MAG: M23 family metallopeptidase [Candidatus Doudnabacteria bacterium]|nr:M23 family metallopeptidase [bacterium]MDZ4243679.1 M23 family metallopeptidase [Candidatus Doudnabacteria bacterium]